MTRLLATTLAVFIAMPDTQVFAQDTAPPPAPASDDFRLPDMGDFLPLHRGTAAPRDGLLVDQDVMLGIVQDFDRLQHQLTLTEQRDHDECEVRVQIEHAHTTAAEERLALRDGLWTARQQELLATIQQAQQQAAHAAERDFFDQPAVWFAIGIIVATVAFIAVSVR